MKFKTDIYFHLLYGKDFDLLCNFVNERIVDGIDVEKHKYSTSVTCPSKTDIFMVIKSSDFPSLVSGISRSSTFCANYINQVINQNDCYKLYDPLIGSIGPHFDIVRDISYFISHYINIFKNGDDFDQSL